VGSNPLYTTYFYSLGYTPIYISKYLIWLRLVVGAKISPIALRYSPVA